ncbi:MAG: hypothetical protein Q7W45_11590 [Bacteroidota bacterium]|nr:hypothetical protein [Bacteroidota bacterium]
MKNKKTITPSKWWGKIEQKTIMHILIELIKVIWSGARNFNT